MRRPGSAASLASIVSVMVAAALAGCSADAGEEAETGSDAIIGGQLAAGSGFNAVGMLRSVGNDGRVSNCTGTLIGPKTVLTAKHCVMDKPGQEGTPTRLDNGRVFFLVGGDGSRPQRVVQVASVETSDLFIGGYTNLGSDVAIYTLRQSITDIAPIPVSAALPTKADEGAAFVAIGYGVQNAAGQSGTRKVGQITLRAVAGAPAKIAYPSVESFVESQSAFLPGPVTEAQKAGLAARYGSEILADYEVFAGEATNDVQVCSGDSGGPLLRIVDGKPVVYGVASTTMAKDGHLCSHGGMYAVFGASTRQKIARALGETCNLDSTTKQLVCGVDAPTTCAWAAGSSSVDGGAPAVAPSPFVTCLADSCCAEASACIGDAECSALNSCFKSCAGTADSSACTNACYRARPSAYGRYVGWQTCARTFCSTAGTP